MNLTEMDTTEFDALMVDLLVTEEILKETLGDVSNSEFMLRGVIPLVKK